MKCLTKVMQGLVACLPATLSLALLLSGGCAEVTRPAPTVAEIEECQLAAIRRHPHQTWTEERVSRVFLKVLAVLPQIHGHTYPFLGFDWWVTESGKVVIDNVWKPSPAHDAELRQGDLILTVNNWPVHPWVKDWDRNMRTTRDLLKDVLGVIRIHKDDKTEIFYGPFYVGELLVSVMLDLKHIAMESRGRYFTGPVQLLVARDGEKFLKTLYPQHLPANYAIYVNHDNREIQAWAAPGKVILTRRLVQFCLNDEELAVVIGHELAHQAHGHLLRGVGQSQVAGAVGKTWKILTAFATVPINRLLNWRSLLWVREDVPSPLQGAMVSVYSREDEREADAYGLWYAYQAGYDPDKGLALWERLGTVIQDPFERTYFLDSHPAPMERLARLKKIAAYFKAGRAAEVFLQSPKLDRKPPPG